MTAVVPTIADLVGPGREAEARDLLEQLLAIETDPDVAHIVRRRVLDGQAWDIIAAEIEMPVSLAYRVFINWAEEMRFYLADTRTERQTV